MPKIKELLFKSDTRSKKILQKNFLTHQLKSPAIGVYDIKKDLHSLASPCFWSFFCF